MRVYKHPGTFGLKYIDRFFHNKKKAVVYRIKKRSKRNAEIEKAIAILRSVIKAGNQERSKTIKAIRQLKAMEKELW